jgi:hypothetical protein
MLISKKIDSVISMGTSKILEKEIRKIIDTYTMILDACLDKESFLKKIELEYNLEQENLKIVVKHFEGITNKLSDIIKKVFKFEYINLGFKREFY